MTFQVIDAERNPLPNVQVHYGISNPETFGFIGFTDKNDSVAWNDLLTGKQNIYHTTGGVGSWGKRLGNHAGLAPNETYEEGDRRYASGCIAARETLFGNPPEQLAGAVANGTFRRSQQPLLHCL